VKKVERQKEKGVGDLVIRRSEIGVDAKMQIKEKLRESEILALQS